MDGDKRYSCIVIFCVTPNRQESVASGHVPVISRVTVAVSAACSHHGSSTQIAALIVLQSDNIIDFSAVDQDLVWQM